MIKFETEKAMKFLNEKLKLQVTGEEQDWDLELKSIFEMVILLQLTHCMGNRL